MWVSRGKRYLENFGCQHFLRFSAFLFIGNFLRCDFWKIVSLLNAGVTKNIENCKPWFFGKIEICYDDVTFFVSGRGN